MHGIIFSSHVRTLFSHAPHLSTCACGQQLLTKCHRMCAIAAVQLCKMDFICWLEKGLAPTRGACTIHLRVGESVCSV